MNVFSQIWHFLASDYTIHLAILVGIYLILAQSFNISFGLGRLFNLAHIASYSIGAYTTALLATTPGIEASFLSCVLASILISGIFSLSIGAISTRLSNDYFAIGTLAFSAIITALLINWKSLTRGVLGIPGIPRPAHLSGEVITIINYFRTWTNHYPLDYPGWDQINFNNNVNFLGLIGVGVLFTLLVTSLVFYGPYARGLRAQAEFDKAAQSLGLNTSRLRNISFVISSAFAGLAGSYFAYYINYIDPSSFMLNEMIFVLTIVVVGRPGSFMGCIAATIFLVLLPEPLRFITIDPSILGPMRQLLYALIMFAVVYINRGRLFPQVREV